MTTPTLFRDVAAPMAANGYSPVPIKPGTKRPPMDGWERFEYSSGCERQYGGCGAGVILGEVVAVDIDVDDADAAAQIENVAREILEIAEVAAIPRRIGNPPRVLIPFQTAVPFRKIKSASFTMRSTGNAGHVEVLADGQQFVAFHVHPVTGRPYTWNGGGDLLTVPRDQLPMMTEAQAREFVAAAEVILDDWGDRVDKPPPTGNGAHDDGEIHEGTRNDSFFVLARKLHNLGLGAEAILAALQVQNRRCNPPLPDDELRSIARSAATLQDRAEWRGEWRGEWPDPQPLPLGLPAVAAFEFNLLPGSLRPWAQDIVDRMRCPADYVGVSIMAAIAAVVGRQVAIRPKAHDDWPVVANLWVLLIGRPGVLKSPAMEDALRPLKRLIALAIKAYNDAVPEHKAKALVTKLRNEAINKAAGKKLQEDPAAIITVASNDDEPPPLRRYMTNDSTMAALAELLRQNPNGLLVHRDELVSLLRALDQEENAEARAFFLTGWNGDSSYTSDRIARGMNLHVEAVCLTLLGSTQPARITEYVSTAVKGGIGDDGMLQRFGMMVWPDIAGEWVNVDRVPDHAAIAEAHKTFAYLDALDYRALGARRDMDHDDVDVGLPYLRLAPDALEVFNDWRHPLEDELRAGTLHPALESHFAKYRSLIPSLALLLHLADRGQGPVTVDAMCKAIAWERYLRTHAHRVYAAATNADAIAARAIVERIRKGDLPAEFSSREVWRPCWRLLSHRQTVIDALTLLVDLGHLRHEERQTAGRKAHVYIVNPKVRTGD